VQSTAAQTEELSSTAQSLTAQARQLQALVSKFVLGDRAERRAEGEVPAPRVEATPATEIFKRESRPAERPAKAVNGHNGNGTTHYATPFEEF